MSNAVNRRPSDSATISVAPVRTDDHPIGESQIVGDDAGLPTGSTQSTPSAGAPPAPPTRLGRSRNRSSRLADRPGRPPCHSMKRRPRRQIGVLAQRPVRGQPQHPAVEHRHNRSDPSGIHPSPAGWAATWRIAGPPRRAPAHRQHDHKSRNTRGVRGASAGTHRNIDPRAALIPGTPQRQPMPGPTRPTTPRTVLRALCCSPSSGHLWESRPLRPSAHHRGDDSTLTRRGQQLAEQLNI